MKRAIPSEFPAKFRKHNIRPTRSFYVTDDATWYEPGEHPCAACALGIEAVDASSVGRAIEAKLRTHVVASLASLAGFEVEYARGLDDGWQALSCADEDARDETYRLGLVDGRAAFMACHAAGLC